LVKLCIDVLMLLMLLPLRVVNLTRVPLHEILRLVFAVVAIMHLLLNRKSVLRILQPGVIGGSDWLHALQG
jgi:hypothetical protein